MNKTKKALLMVLCAALLVVGSVLGTLAYLTSTDTVTNTFTVGQVAITLDEALVDDNGKEITGESANRVKANEYHLLPGHEYDKDPTIHVDEKSEDCWLFVKVENQIAAIEDATTIADQMTAKGWTAVANATNIYAYKETVSAGKDVVVFENFKIKGDVDNVTLNGREASEDVDAVEGYKGKTIKVTAYAVQADGFTTAAAAWTAAGLN